MPGRLLLLGGCPRDDSCHRMSGGDCLANYAKMSLLAGCYHSHRIISFRDY